MDLKREPTRTTLLEQQNSLLHSKAYLFIHRKVQLPSLIKEVHLEFSISQMQVSDIIETNKFWVAQPQRLHLPIALASKAQ